jgi:hypothetical protein
MKVFVLAGALAAVAFPAAAAADIGEPCPVEETRSSLAPDRAEPVSTPAPTAPSRQSTAQREPESRAETTRRRSGKRLPDAELIGPRGAL